MRTLVRNAVLVFGVLVFFAWAIVPPEEQLRLGKDLRGGVGLVYSVQIGPGEDSKRVLSKTIEVLKDRVDPEGLYDISMISQGRDRIEITMPLQGEAIKDLRAAYDAEIAALEASAITQDQIESAVRLAGAEREAALGALSGGDQTRAELLARAAAAHDEANARRASLDAAQQAGAGVEVIDPLVEAVAGAELEYERARGAVMATVLAPQEVRRAVELSNRGRRIIDDETKQVQTFASPRERALERLKEAHPDLTDEIDRIVAAYDAFASQRTTLADPADLIRLLRGAGVLEFRITVEPGAHPEESRLRRELQERGPRNVRSTDAHWYKINRIDNWFSSVQEERALRENPAGYFGARNYVAEEYDGEHYMLAWDTRGTRLTKAEGQWAVANAFESSDQLGKPAISFTMNAAGALRLGDLTGAHVGEQMAVLLDDQVYTAPNLLSRIAGNGQITGDFSEEERNYVIRVLAAGSLQAKLSPDPISQSILGPELGADNLRQGLRAGWISLIAVSAFMIFYYFNCGVIAVASLLCNAVLIVGAMALNKAAFTLPGIAGVILTFGMAVDANVLIYERMREEMLKGADLKTAVRLGYQRALASIVDANVTNLIICVVLGAVGTPEIKGFAITLGIGVVTTMFSALVISRLLFDFFINVLGWSRTSMLPLAVPALQRALEPKVNWLRYRWVFWTISAVYVALGLAMVAFRGEQMLDTEFRGGTQITIQFRDDPTTGEPLKLRRKDVEDRVRDLATEPAAGSQLHLLRTAEILPLNPESDGITSDRFTIRTIATDDQAVSEALIGAFADEMASHPPLRFAGIEAATPTQRPVYRVVADVLGQNIDRPEYRDDVRDYLGGVAIVLENLEPAPTLEALETRLDDVRGQRDYSDTLARLRTIKVLDGDAGAVRAAVVLVRDPNLSLFENEDRWTDEVADREWRLAVDALSEASTPASVQTFSPTIADTFKAQAVVAIVLSFLLIMIYVWVRFGAARYAVASIVPLVHDVLTVVGLLALAEIIYDWHVTESFAQAVGLLPFKIDLNMIAAFLTIIGYSINDTIVVMDRIRENRGKLDYATTAVINTSINQTMSRTVITGGGVLFSTLILYIIGGEGVRGFAFALFIGVVIGTYSSFAIAAPIVWSKKEDPTAPSA